MKQTIACRPSGRLPLCEFGGYIYTHIMYYRMKRTDSVDCLI